MKLTDQHKEALSWVQSGLYRTPGNGRPDLSVAVSELKLSGMVLVKAIPNAAVLVLSREAQEALSHN